VQVRPTPPPAPRPDEANTEIPWWEARETGDVNVIYVSGRLGHDPVLERTRTKGVDFCVLRVAVTRVTEFRSREPIKETHWISWIAFGAMARKIVSRYFKGCYVMITGYIETFEYIRVHGGGDPRRNRARRESHIIKWIRLLAKPAANRSPLPRPDRLAGTAGPGTGHPDRYVRKYDPDPGDTFDTYECDMPDDAKAPPGELPPAEIF